MTQTVAPDTSDFGLGFSSGLSTLSCHNFRNYTSLKLDIPLKPIVITGANGSGKTNLLEAVSLLSPGRGLRKQKIAEMMNCTQDPAEGWAVAATLMDDVGPLNVGTGFQPDPLNPNKAEKRSIRINGVTARSQEALNDLTSIIWLTPLQDRIFVGASSERRQFMDRLISALNPQHNTTLYRYEHAVRERLRLLKSNRWDPTWVKSLEKKIAEAGSALTFMRQEYVQEISQATTWSRGVFPRAEMRMVGTLETFLSQNPMAKDLEDYILVELENRRAKDAAAGMTTFGAHKSDLEVTYTEKSMPAHLCSTGEQKALLLSLIMSAAHVQAFKRPGIPILLLDEVIAHLDANRRCTLFQEMLNLGIQVWMTGTDEESFSEILKDSCHLKVKLGAVDIV